MNKLELKIKHVIFLMTQLIQSFNSGILIDEKLHENILIFGISYKTLIGRKPSCISFEKLNGFIRIYDRNRYLMFGSEKYDAIYNGTKSFKVVKSGVTKIFSGFCSKIKVDSHDSLPIETD